LSIHSDMLQELKQVCLTAIQGNGLLLTLIA
jgi:hypothetical protein